MRQYPDTPDWTFDMRWEGSTALLTVGDTTWVDAGGTTHQGQFLLTKASFTLQRNDNRWSQRMVWQLWENTVYRGEFVRTNTRPVAFDLWTGDYMFLSDHTPAATGRTTALGALPLRQAVGTAPAITFRYVIR